MCGRFARIIPLAQIIEQFEIDTALSDLAASYNIAPGTEVAAIVIDGGKKLVTFKWGLVPSWAKEASIGNRMINARAETLKQKPSFRNALKKRRCLIIASGFYEWKKEGKEKVPVYIRLKNDSLFTFAGLYEFWKAPPPDGRTIGTCTIITTEANSLLKSIHDRMPVIIKKEDHELWLDCAQDEQLVLPFLAPYPSEEMEAHEVSKTVNLPKHDGPECIKPVK